MKNLLRLSEEERQYLDMHGIGDLCRERPIRCLETENVRISILSDELQADAEYGKI